MDPRRSDTRVATALFADISGFTALADRLDAEELHEVIEPVISRLAAVAEREGGYIAKYAGDALLVLFGAPDPEPDHVDRAVRTAAEMHVQLTRLIPELPEAAADLFLHIGVDTGDVVTGMMARATRDDVSILGDAVISAQRLESRAPSGETYVGDASVAHALVGEGFAIFEPVDGMHAWRLKSVPAEAEVGAYDAGAFAATQLAERMAGSELEERRLVTVLFADVAGFRALADRVTPQQLHEIVAPIVRRLGEVAGRYGGFAARFAGDAFMAFFGAPTSHEDDPSRALLAAVDMHHEMESMKSELPSEAAMLRLRIGVNSGHVVSGQFGGERRNDYSILGDAVNLAQRLESVAPAGATYVGQLTCELTRTRFELEALGALRLKGKAERVQAWRLVGERDRTGRGRHGRPAAPLFGRDAEVAALTGLLDGLEAGRGGVVAVLGEAGAGKSRLAAEVERLARERGVRWLTTRCPSYGAGLVYWPYADLVRRVYGIGIEDPPDEAARRLQGALGEIGVPEALPYFARLIGVPSPGDDEVAGLDPEAFRRGLHAAFAAVIKARAARVPIVIEIEDVHWADASSLEMTKDLARLCGDTAFAMYVTARPEASDVIAEIEASSRGRTVHAELRPLDEAAIGDLVRWVLGGDPPRGLVEAVMERTGGNPFFTEELVLALREAGTLTLEDGGWRLQKEWHAEAVPHSVEGVLAARIDLLPKSVAIVLQTASVMGRRVRLGLLRAVTGSGRSLDTALDRLLDDGFLDPRDTTGEAEVEFHHALIVDVAYSRMVRKRRTALHLRMAEACEALYGSGDDVIDLLARHFYLGGARARALPYLERAADRAKRLFANGEAIEHLARAAEICRDEPSCSERTPRILFDLADLHDVVGNYDHALELFSEVRERTNEVRAWRGLAAVLRKQGQYHRVFELIDAALGEGQIPSGELAPLWLERGWSLCISGRYAEGADALREGIQTLANRDDPIRGHLLLQLARAESTLGDRQAALTHVIQAQEEFQRRGDLRGLATSLRVGGEVLAALDRHDESIRTLLRGLEVGRTVGVVEEIGGCLVNLGFVHCTMGDYDAAIECDLQAIEEFEPAGHEFGRATAYANLADHLVRSGRPEEARGRATTALEIAGAIGFTPTVADASLTLAKADLSLGDFEAAAEHAERGAGMFAEMGYEELAADGYEVAVTALEGLGDEERARALRDRARSSAPSSSPA
ncbi:MAG: adenylate/guanylate cyclase domain-containing protein [Actinomycetota bacterium]